MLAARQAESTAAGIAYRASRPKPPKEANALSAVAAELAAKEAGRGFYEVQLDVAHSERGVEFGSSDIERHRKSTSYVDTLGEIEAIGWRLEHVGYIFLVTGESSRDKLLSTGQRTAVSGRTVGIYLFRNTDRPA